MKKPEIVVGGGSNFFRRDRRDLPFRFFFWVRVVGSHFDEDRANVLTRVRRILKKRVHAPEDIFGLAFKCVSDVPMMRRSRR